MDSMQLSHESQSTCATNYGTNVIIPATSTSFTVHSQNYQDDDIPDGVTDIIISSDLNTSLYKDIKALEEPSSSDTSYPPPSPRLYNITILGSKSTEIPQEAFCRCKKIKSIKIPPSVESIGRNAFSLCSLLEMVEFLSTSTQSKLTSIERGAFAGCTKLRSINIPESVTDIGPSAFEYCLKLQAVTLPKSLTTCIYDDESGQRLRVEKGIARSAFHQCKSLQTMQIPEGITCMMRQAFEDCVNLQSIILPDSLIEIQAKAFKNCSSLLSIVIPHNVQFIGKEAFDECYNLQNIVLPKSCAYTKPNFFDRCMDQIIRERGQEWLQHRFDALPIHQLCYNHNVNLDDLSNISTNDPLRRPLRSVDAMNLTPLHVLSCNPNVSLEMIRILASKHPGAAFVETNKNHKNAFNFTKMFPIEMYLITKNIVCWNEEQREYHQRNKIRTLMHTGTKQTYYDINDIVRSGLSDNLWDIVLAFQGLSLDNELSEPEVGSGLLPFMRAATDIWRPLECLYKIAMKKPELICKHKQHNKRCRFH